MFNVEFVGSPQIEFGELAARGRITLRDFSEEFVAPLIFWAADDYRRQWRDAAERILSGCERSCFVAAMRQSPLYGAIFLWPAYRDGEVVYIQHKLLLPQLVRGSFDPSNPYAQIDERRALSDESEQISEWQVSVGDIARFLHTG
jgi:CdiI N-terminal domain